MNLAGRLELGRHFPIYMPFSFIDVLSPGCQMRCKLIQIICHLPALAVLLGLTLNAFSVPVHAQNTLGIPLTAEEKLWLKAHPVIRVGMDADYPPYSFVAFDGSYQGVAPDFFDRIGGMLGVRFDIVAELKWPQILQGAKERSLDTIATAVWTEERAKFLDFTKIYIPTPLVIMTRSDDDRINASSDLTGMKIALVKDYSSTNKVLQEHPSVQQLQVDTSLDGLRAVAVGEADAYIGVLGVSTFLASKHGIHNLKIAASYEMAVNGQRIGVRKDWPELVAILDKSINAIPELEKIDILNKWVPVGIAGKKPSPLRLSEEERFWLSQHREIRLAIDPDFAPVEFIDEQGNYSGISADYVDRLSEKLGITMRVIPGISWSQALTLAKKGEIDVFAAITATDERKEYLGFTKPYFTYPVVIYTRSDSHIISGLHDLFQKKIAVVKDYFVHESLRQKHPELELILADSNYDGLSIVSTGGADAFIGDIATATYAMRKINLTNLKIAAPAEIESPGHSFGVRKDWPELVSLFNKAMESMPPEEHLDISKKWIELEIEVLPRYWIWVALTTAGLTIIFFLVNTILRKQVRARTAELGLKNQQLEQENIERQRAERALIDSEKRLNQFFHATFETVFFHEGGRILDANPATRIMTGYTSDEVVGRNVLEFVAEDSRQYVVSQMSAGAEEPYEANIVTSTGVVMPVEIQAASIDMGDHIARVVSLRDITERKRSELALQHAHDMLENKVAERTAELSLANTKLKELDQLKSMFIASVSHELRTPLDSIIGFSSMMMQGAFGELGDKYKDYTARINKSGQHLLSLITDIIDISKIESGYVDTDFSDVELRQIVAEAINNMRQQAEHKSLALEESIPQEMVLYTDRRRLLQCLLNYLSNAVKYSERGIITVYAEAQGEDVKISVRDSGIGIGIEDMTRLFDAFERLDSHLRVKAGGTGLGLYLTKKIAIELLQGEVGVDSKPGAGSTFWIKVPKTAQRRLPKNDMKGN